MAAGPFILFGYGKYKSLNQEIDYDNDVFKAILIGSAWTPNVLTDEMYADIIADETANGNGYTTGGVLLSNTALTYSIGVSKFDCDDFLWTPSAGSIVGAYVVIYNATHADDPLIAYTSLDSGNDITAETSPLSIVINANGIWTS